jgi:hypothetical protein
MEYAIVYALTIILHSALIFLERRLCQNNRIIYEVMGKWSCLFIEPRYPVNDQLSHASRVAGLEGIEF